jgi:hypothetical protein
MLFILDEHIPESVGDALVLLGFEFITVSRALGSGTKDRSIAEWAELHCATVVTMNSVHFAKYISRRPSDSPNAFRRAGLLSFDCIQRRMRGRIEQVGHLLHRECHHARERKDNRIFLEIGIDYAKFKV